MLALYISIIAIGGYLIATAMFIKYLVKININIQHWRGAMWLIGLALLCHLLTLWQSLFTAQGLNVSFYTIASLIAWLITFIVLLTTLKKPLENVLILLGPLAALAVFLDLIFPAQHLVSELPHALKLHIITSICAYSLIAIASLQSVVLLFQERQLRGTQLNFIMRILPPLQIIENMLLKFLWAGFVLLNISLVSGFMFLHDIMQQHLAHKIILSVLAWFIFGTVLLARWRHGWRGKKMAYWIISGFISLLLAYFGSKFVLELILQRV